jgi:IS30 family transposase
VVRLREQEQLPFKQIAKHLGVCVPTVSRAYDYARPDAVRVAAETGRRMQRGSCARLPEAVRERIRAGLKAGRRQADIAADVGCSICTVALEQKRLRAQSGNAKIPRRRHENRRAAA